MSNPRNARTSLLHRLGVAGPARVRAFGGSGASTKRGCAAHLRNARFLLPAFVLAGLLFTAAPAMAALETPEKEAVSAVTAMTAHVSGVLNPKATGGVEGGFYGFFYGLSEPAVCGEEKLVPEPFGSAGIAAGMPKEVKEETLTGLQPHAKYTFCLLELNEKGTEQLEGTPVLFETEAAPPEIVLGGESATPVKTTEATLRAVVNPNNEPTKYKFEYAKSATGETLNAPVTTVEGAPPATELEGYGGAPASASTGAVLEPNKTYYYRVVAENAQSEKEVKPVEGPVRSFATTTPSKEQATTITGTTATLSGVLNPAKAGEADAYEFLYKASPTECEGESETPYTSASGGPAEAVKAELTGLLPHTTYTFCVQEYNEVSEATVGPAVTFTTSAAGITGEASAEVGATSAKLSAQIDPGGAETTYYVEYGTSEAYSSSTPAVSAGAGSAYGGVQATLAGLQSDTVYHYRFVAKSSFGAALGPDATFTTFPPSASALPDDRAYELVSDFPAGTGEEAYAPLVAAGIIDTEEHGIKTGLPFRVAPDGEAVAFPAEPPPTRGTGDVGSSNGNEYLATRTAKGWEARDIQPPGAVETVYTAFSSDLSVGIIHTQGGESESFAEAAPEGYPDFYDTATATAGGTGAEYHPFITSTPQNRGPQEFNLNRGNYAGGNAGTSAVPALSQLLFEADDALPTLNVAAAGGSGEDQSSHLPFAEENNLYDSAGGGLYLVNVLPDGATEVNASFGSPEGSAFSEAPHGVSHVISADGSRIFWSATEGGEFHRRVKALYVRENDTSPGASTVLVTEGGEPRFWAANSEGSLVFYTKEVAQGNDLYEFDLDSGQTTDLSVDLDPSESAEVQGVVGSSEDGSYVYFAADGVLAGESAGGEKPISGQPNLYLSHEGSTTFIAALSPEDGAHVKPLEGISVGDAGDWQAAGGHRTAEVTPDGQSLVFMTERSLTGYDNAAQTSEGAGGGLQPVDEVFLFQAQSSRLTCVSCNPSGEPPVPTEFNTHYYDNSIGGFIPISKSFAGEQPRVISEDGDRVFFDSGEPLLPTATNGWLNVYEWERAGTPGGSCPEGAPNGGCVYLISSGTDPEDSYLLGTDASGANAFFISRAQLVASDRGDEGDVVYDARVDGTQPPAEAACSGTGCQGVPPTPPIFATPSSVTFNGIGNFPPAHSSVPPKKTTKKATKCKKDFVKKHNRCAKKAKTKKRRAKKASDRRGASR
jgi:Tol biopolymer transport system component